MTDIEQQQRILQFQKIKSVTQSLLPLSEKVTRSNSKAISSLLYRLYADLEGIQDAEALMSKPNTDLVILSLITLYKSMTKQEKYGYEIIIEPWLKIMNFLLSKTLIKTWMPPKFTIELFTLFSNLIGQTKYEEEIKYLSVLCLSGSLPAKYKEGRYSSFKESIYYSLVKPFQSDTFLPIASAGIVALLSVIQGEQDIKLRLKSLKVLSQLLFDNINDADLISTFLPGIASKLCTTISQKGEKENHQIICSCLKVLKELIELTMCDEDNHTLVQIESFQDALNHYKNTTEGQIELNNGNQKRDKVWYTKSKENLFNVMKQILKIRFYPDWRTRLEFIEFSYTLLFKCAYTLDNCIQSLIEMIILHIDDPYPQVSNNCKLYIQLLKSKSSFEDTIVPILKQELYEWIMKFPKYIISRDELEKSNIISLIIGFIILLGEQSSSVLSIVLDRSSDGWMTALEIDKDCLNILEEKKNQQFIELETENIKSTPIYPTIRFKYIVNDSTTTKLTRLLNIIGKFCDLKNWIYHFIRYLSTENNNDPQAAYIIHSLLFGAFAFELDDIDSFIYNEDINEKDYKIKLNHTTLDLLKDIMDILSNSIKSTNTTKLIEKNNFKLDQESGYILTVCFSLKIVGLTASILDQQDLQDQFITILYPLLAHLGSTNIYIHTYALITLDSIAIVCGLNNAKELAIQNIDYIINMISQHISILSDNARVPLVLKALIHVGGYASIGYLDDTILEIYDALERYNSNNWLCIQLCAVLFEIVQTIEKNKPKKKNIKKDSINQKENQVSIEIKSFIENNTNNNEDKEHATMEEIGKYFLNRQEKGKHDNITLEQSIMELPIDLPADKKEEEKEENIPLNKEELMVKEIMNRSSHFLTASSPQLRSQMLILLTHGVSILSNHPSELNQFIHTIWTPIINRFNDEQNYVVFHAAHLIENLSSVSTDFLSRKFIDDLWPKFKMILRKGIQAAKTNRLSDYSIYSLYHRTQLCLFKTLTQIIYHVPINQPMVKEILEETKYYYKNNQVHEQLLNGCQELFNALSIQQPDTVWFYEFSLTSQQLNSPCNLLDNFIIPEWMKHSGTDYKSIKL